MQTIHVIVALHLVKSPTLVLSAQVIRIRCQYLDPPDTVGPFSSPPLITVWKRQQVQLVEDSGVTTVIVTPPPLRPVWVCQVLEFLPILLLLPPARNHLPVAINKQGSSKIMPTITGVCYIPPEHRKPPRVMVKKTKREIMIPRGGFFTSNTAIAKFTARESACIYNSVPPDSTK